MATRTVQFIASTKGSLNLRLVWNNSEVYNGLVPEQSNLSPLLTWETSTKLFGFIPFEIHVTGDGELTWADLHMNYSGDYDCLPGAQSSGAIRVAPVEYFAPPCVQNESGDGKSNIFINDIPISNERAPEDIDLIGAWHYNIPSPGKLTCLYRIDRALIKLYSPNF